jgi:long-chain fatty acid transport protein
MKKGWIATWFGIVSLVLLPGLAFGNGFAINEQGAKAVAMGGAFVAQADDPTGVYYNPAGIVQLGGTQVSLGISAILPDASFESSTNDPIFRHTSPGQTTGVEDNTFYIPNAYITQKYNDRLSFGLGLFSNFGLMTEWPEDWAGRFIPGGVKAELTTYSVNPVVAFKPVDRVSLAVGPVLQYFDFTLKSKQFTGGPELDAKFEGNDWNWGWNVGLLVWITDNLKFGASYRSEVKHDIKNGNLEFSPNIPGFPDTGISTDFDTPAIGYLGVAYTWSALTVEFDAQWTDWSTFNKLAASFDQPVAGQSSLTVQEDWKDAWAYRFGAQYKLNEYLDLRAGIIFDASPIPDKSVSPRLPSGDRWLYCIGFGTHYKGFDLDFAYNYLDDESRKLGSTAGQDDVYHATGVGPLTGKFKDVDAHIFGLNLTYKF